MLNGNERFLKSPGCGTAYGHAWPVSRRCQLGVDKDAPIHRDELSEGAAVFDLRLIEFLNAKRLGEMMINRDSSLSKAIVNVKLWELERVKDLKISAKGLDRKISVDLFHVQNRTDISLSKLMSGNLKSDSDVKKANESLTENIVDLKSVKAKLQLQLSGFNRTERIIDIVKHKFGMGYAKQIELVEKHEARFNDAMDKLGADAFGKVSKGVTPVIAQQTVSGDAARFMASAKPAGSHTSESMATMTIGGHRDLRSVAVEQSAKSLEFSGHTPGSVEAKLTEPESLLKQLWGTYKRIIAFKL